MDNHIQCNICDTYCKYGMFHIEISKAIDIIDKDKIKSEYYDDLFICEKCLFNGHIANALLQKEIDRME